MAEGLPSGTVTFLFTDVEGSTGLWESAPDAAGAAVRAHDEIVRRAIEAHGGHVFATGGDSFSAAFGRVADAVDAARDAQQALTQEAWPDRAAIKVRIGIHTGEADERGGDYFGSAVNRAARVMDAGHGGQVLLSQVTADLVPDLETVDLGEHVLKSLDTPIGLRQLVIDGLESEFGALRTVGTASSTIKPPRNELVGRDDLVGRTRKALIDGRLVSLTGAGGAGKTRLAIEVGNELIGIVPGGVYFVDLSKVTDEGLLAASVAEGLGLSLGGIVSADDAIRRQLSKRESLMVVDNCEHLIDDVADLVDDLLVACPHLKVLATSREALGVDGEVVIRLPGLRGDAAVRLFSQAAGRDTSDWSGDEKAAIGEICTRLDGLPLAIELAAARTGALSVSEIAANLDDRFALLTGGRRRTRGRAQTLLATVQWSYDLLDGAEQKALDALSVMPGSFGLDLASAVLGSAPAQTAALLDDLVARSLVQADPSAEADFRYRLLETIRVFAGDRLRESGAEEAVRDRHMAAVVDRLGESLWLASSVEQSRLSDDALVAYDWARRRDDVHSGFRLAQTVIDALMSRGAFERSDEVLQWVSERDDPDAAAWAWAMGAFQGVWRNDGPLILECSKRALAIAPDSEGALICRMIRAASFAPGDPARSLAEIEQYGPRINEIGTENGTMAGPFTYRWAEYSALMWADRVAEAVRSAKQRVELTRGHRMWVAMSRADLLAASLIDGDVAGIDAVLAEPNQPDFFFTASSVDHSSRAIDAAALAHTGRLDDARKLIADLWADRPETGIPGADQDVAVSLAECAMVADEPTVAAGLLDACGFFARHQGATGIMYRRLADLASVPADGRVAFFADEMRRRMARDAGSVGARDDQVRAVVDGELARLGLR